MRERESETQIVVEVIKNELAHINTNIKDLQKDFTSRMDRMEKKIDEKIEDHDKKIGQVQQTIAEFKVKLSAVYIFQTGISAVMAGIAAFISHLSTRS